MPPSGSTPACPPDAEPAASAAPVEPAEATEAVEPAASTTEPDAAATERGTRATALTVLILGSLTALTPLSIDMYLPALPTVTKALGSTAAQIQLSLTACLVGLAVGQLVIGPMSDTWGRRRPLLIGTAVYILASVACAFAMNAEVLTGLRLLQGLSGAAGVVIARAVVRDLTSGLAAARLFSSLMLVSGVAPIAAPVIGGQLLRFTSWRGIFVVLAVLGLVILVLTAVRLPETLPPKHRHQGGLGDTLRTMRGLFADRLFTGYVLTCGISFASLFAYVSGSPFVLQGVFGASAQTYSLMFGLNSIGIVGVTQLNGRVLINRFPMERLMTVGILIAMFAGAGLLVTVTATGGGLLPVAVLLWVMVASLGLVMPNATALALSRADHSAGSASALLGTLQFLIGAAVAPLVGLAGEDSAVPMAVVITATATLALTVFLTMCRRR
jgi:DHA1 family bicyclomycin/chloramphenicol resistance-like MFS transporter